MLLAYPLPVLSAAVLPSHKALVASVDSHPPRENTTTVGAHRGSVLLLCYRAAAGFAIRAGPSSPSPPRRRAVSPIAVGGSTSTGPRNGREGRRVLVAGRAFFTQHRLRSALPRPRVPSRTPSRLRPATGSRPQARSTASRRGMAPALPLLVVSTSSVRTHAAVPRRPRQCRRPSPRLRPRPAFLPLDDACGLAAPLQPH